jgi:hypothetical protein
MNTVTPSIGRIVHYVNNNRCYAAVVTNVWSNESVNLNIMNDASFPIEDHLLPTASPYSIVKANVQYSDTQETHTWHWPERVN